MSNPRRQPPPQSVLAVEATEQLGPHLVRVIAGGDEVERFASEYTDSYVKLFFADPGAGLTPPYDMAAIRESLPVEQWPVPRTYTLRWVDTASRRLAIDFVTHGDEGYAGPWAGRATPGDQLVLAGPGGAYAPDPEASWHVFAGDLSAVPAIAAAMEALPGDARGIAHLEVPSAADILDLRAPGGVKLNWFVNAEPVDASALAGALDDGNWPEEGVQVFAHGERESIKAVRVVLKSRGIPREAISISGYWARGRTEDVFQAEKREPIGQIEPAQDPA